MRKRDAASGIGGAAARSGRGGRGFDLPRVGAVAALYAAYVVAACLLVGPALDAVDAAFPSAFFYHLQEGEADGPIGDLMRLATGMWLQLLAFWLVFAPLALRLRAPAGLLAALTVFDEPILLATMVGLARRTAGLPFFG